MRKRRSNFVPPRGYVTVTEAARQGGYSVARLAKLLTEGRILGTKKVKGRRVISVPVMYMSTKGIEKPFNKRPSGISGVSPIQELNVQAAMAGSHGYMQLDSGNDANDPTVTMTKVGIWLVDWSPVGDGCVVFVAGSITPRDRPLMVYANSTALARYVQRHVETDEDFKVETAPVFAMTIEAKHMPTYFYMQVQAIREGAPLELTWHEVMTPIGIHHTLPDQGMAQYTVQAARAAELQWGDRVLQCRSKHFDIAPYTSAYWQWGYTLFRGNKEKVRPEAIA